MLKLIKYEFRKTMFSKMILLAITAVFEIIYLAGVFLEREDALGIGVFGLVLCAVVGIMYIGIESINVFHKDLNTKQSYMLFLTPNSSFKILGAKVLENGISILISGAFFAVLAAVDISTGILYIGGLEEFLDMLDYLFISLQVNINITPESVLMAFAVALASWLMIIVTADFAVVLAATVFAGKKFSGLVSFILFLLIDAAGSKIMECLPVLANDYAEFALNIGAIFIMVIVMYFVTGWIMDRKLSV